MGAKASVFMTTTPRRSKEAWGRDGVDEDRPPTPAYPQPPPQHGHHQEETEGEQGGGSPTAAPTPKRAATPRRPADGPPKKEQPPTGPAQTAAPPRHRRPAKTRVDHATMTPPKSCSSSTEHPHPRSRQLPAATSAHPRGGTATREPTPTDPARPARIEPPAAGGGGGTATREPTPLDPATTLPDPRGSRPRQPETVFSAAAPRHQRRHGRRAPSRSRSSHSRAGSQEASPPPS